MKDKPSSVSPVALAATLISIILLIVPFHAFLTVWLASLIGHYTLLRLWKEFLLLVLVLIAGGLLIRNALLRKRIFNSKLTWTIVAYSMVQLVWGAVAYAQHGVTRKALAYGVLVNLRFLACLLAVWIVASCAPRLHQNWRRLVILPAMLVIIIALLQYFALPYDFLKHFGYNASTIFPYETINHNIHYIRVMSTLRGANPLGAYLVLILSLLLVLWRRHLRDWPFAILPVAGVVALILTFSRGAWVGFVLSLLVVGLSMLRTKRAKQLAGLGAVAIIVVAAGLAVVLRHNATFENVFSHTQEHSAVATTSNEGHRSALRSGLHDLLHQPLGRGPGTAGPASEYNTRSVALRQPDGAVFQVQQSQTRIAENYFVQIGQETGWIGLALFVTINVLLGRELWRRRDDPLAFGLFAALIGLSFVNMLSHAWTDDTLAYLFWGLAGIALADPLKSPAKTKKA